MTVAVKAMLAGLLALGVGAGGVAYLRDAPATDATTTETVAVTIAGAGGAHRFLVELADTAAEQSRGLMYRTDLKPDGGMLFAPYPPEGGPPRDASFWMKNTPSSLDIVFIRADRSIARIAENTVPLSEQPVASGEPVAAVLEVPGGRMAELGLAEGDRVDWAHPKR
ncbi:MAG TPA: DUF192 domain-containing protein [Sphingomonas sp.]|jgi:hypothetical protein|uniref:DUF192 domain-containing protein n=1 Tax=Sphingomonas sp. TaxID=28214 RepID=UPI002EDA8F61